MRDVQVLLEMSFPQQGKSLQEVWGLDILVVDQIHFLFHDADGISYIFFLLVSHFIYHYY